MVLQDSAGLLDAALSCQGCSGATHRALVGWQALDLPPAASWGVSGRVLPGLLLTCLETPSAEGKGQTCSFSVPALLQGGYSSGP